MIYLPHPSFNFEISDGGGAVGFVPFNEWWQHHNTGEGLSGWVNSRVFMPMWNIDITKVISKFDKARSGYWEGKHYSSPDTSYCFLREDGCEVAVRFIKANGRWDIIGYWVELDKSPFLISYIRILSEFKIWLENQCPSSKGNPQEPGY